MLTLPSGQSHTPVVILNGVFEMRDPSQLVCIKGFFGKKRLRSTYFVAALLPHQGKLSWL